MPHIYLNAKQCLPKTKDEVVMEYKGFKYMPEKDYEDDNIKTFHDVVTPEGKRIFIPWSPYSYPSKEDFEMWVDMDCPGIIYGENGSMMSNGNFTHESLQELWRNSLQFIKEI